VETIIDFIGKDVIYTILAAFFSVIVYVFPKVIRAVNTLGKAISMLAEAAQPESDGGTTVTPEEWKAIVAKFKDLGKVFTKVELNA